MDNGQNEYEPYKKRTKRLSNGQRTHIYRSKRMKRMSSDNGHEVHSRYCVRDCSHFLKFFINMHEYVNKIICILNYDKTEHYKAFIWY